MSFQCCFAAAACNLTVLSGQVSAAWLRSEGKCGLFSRIYHLTANSTALTSRVSAPQPKIKFSPNQRNRLPPRPFAGARKQAPVSRVVAATDRNFTSFLPIFLNVQTSLVLRRRTFHRWQALTCLDQMVQTCKKRVVSIELEKSMIPIGPGFD